MSTQVLNYIPVTGLENTTEYEHYLEEIRQTTGRNIVLFKNNTTIVKRRIGFLIRYYELDVPAKSLPISANFTLEQLTDRNNIYGGLLNLVLSFDNLIEKTKNVEDNEVFGNLTDEFDKLYEQICLFENWLMKYKISPEPMEEMIEFEEYEEYFLEPKKA